MIPSSSPHLHLLLYSAFQSTTEPNTIIPSYFLGQATPTPIPTFDFFERPGPQATLPSRVKTGPTKGNEKKKKLNGNEASKLVGKVFGVLSLVLFWVIFTTTTTTTSIIHRCYMKMMNMEIGMIHAFSSAICFMFSGFLSSALWHFWNFSKRLMVFFGFWFLVLGHLSTDFFAGDNYLRHSALDSNCIYSFCYTFYLCRINLAIAG